jgi:hypothetical protein
LLSFARICRLRFQERYFTLSTDDDPLSSVIEANSRAVSATPRWLYSETRETGGEKRVEVEKRTAEIGLFARAPRRAAIRGAGHWALCTDRDGALR